MKKKAVDVKSSKHFPEIKFANHKEKWLALISIIITSCVMTGIVLWVLWLIGVIK